MTSALAEAPPTPGALNRALVTFTGLTAAFTMVLSGTIVNVAVPDIMGAFGIGQDKAQFVSTAYIATMTASQLLNAWFIAVFGRRVAFTIVLVLFVAGALVCASSPNIDVVIAGRIMQGFSSGIIQPLVMTTIISVFPPDRRGTAVGVYIGGLALALGFGPVVGGITVDSLGWRWIFLVSLPIVGTALLLGAFFMPDDGAKRERPPFDWTGYSLLCLALFCLMSAVASGQREGWDSDLLLAYWLVGGGAALGFVRSQVRESATLLDLSLFADPRFAAAILLTSIFGIGNFAITYAIPVFGQLVIGLTPTAAGLLLMPAGIVAMFFTLGVGRLSDQVSPLVLILIGLGTFVLGCIMLSGGDANTPFASIALFAVACRVGTAFVGPSLTGLALKALPADALNAGSGTINFFRQMGGAFGINALVALLERRTELHADAMAATQLASNSATREMLRETTDLLSQTGLPEPVQHQAALDMLARMIEAQAGTLAWREGFLAITAVFVFALLPTWLLAHTSRRRRAA